jgi:hypothetical protein
VLFHRQIPGGDISVAKAYRLPKAQKKSMAGRVLTPCFRCEHSRGYLPRIGGDRVTEVKLNFGRTSGQLFRSRISDDRIVVRTRRPLRRILLTNVAIRTVVSKIPHRPISLGRGNGL